MSNITSGSNSFVDRRIWPGRVIFVSPLVAAIQLFGLVSVRFVAEVSSIAEQSQI